MSAIRGMIDIQQNGQVADQGRLYEVVVNGDRNGDLRIISVSRIIFLKLPIAEHVTHIVSSLKYPKFREGVRMNWFWSSLSSTGGPATTRWWRCPSRARTPSTSLLGGSLRWEPWGTALGVNSRPTSSALSSQRFSPSHLC